MELKEPLKNGVLIVHQVEEGKHEYEVKNVVKLKNSSWRKVFVSGDKLMQINGKDLQDVTPEEVAEMLAEGNPMLTIHKPGKKKVKPGEEAPPCKETLQPFSKEYTTLTFEWKMIRGEQSEVCQQEKEKEEEEEAETELEYKEEERMEEKDLLVIKMTKTSISLVRGRGCDVNSPCQGCNGSGCVFNDIVVVAESSQVTLVPRGSDSFKQEKMLNVLVEHVPSRHYLHVNCSQKMAYASPNPERITIYSYRSISTDCPFRGVPVVLNLTGSNCFLKCCSDETSVIIQVEVFDKQRLKVISTSDHTKLCFVFYMKGDRSGHRTFESALHKDRFIHIVNSEAVQVGRLDGQLDEESFFFVIQK